MVLLITQFEPLWTLGCFRGPGHHSSLCSWPMNSFITWKFSFCIAAMNFPSCLIFLAQWLATAIIAEVLPNQKKQEFGLFLEVRDELYQLFSIFVYSHIQQRGTEHRYYKSDWQKIKAAKKQICGKRRFCFKCESLVAVAPQCTADAVHKESSVQHWYSAGQYGIACLLWQISSWYAHSTPAKGVCNFVMSTASFFW